MREQKSTPTMMTRGDRKTAKGAGELDRHDLQLRPELRRLLILIDGKRSVESLAPMFRANELTELIDELLNVGAIEQCDTAVSYVPPTVAFSRAPALDSAEFKAARETAKSFAKTLLGRSADSLLVSVENAADWQSFRVAVSAVQLRLISQRGEEAATRYVTAIRDAVRAAARSSSNTP
jgi:hypothetical protein